MAVKVYESIIEKASSLEAELCSGIGRLYLQVMYNSVNMYSLVPRLPPVFVLRFTFSGYIYTEHM